MTGHSTSVFVLCSCFGFRPSPIPQKGHSIPYFSAHVAEMGDRLATIDMGRKVWVCCAHFWGIGEGRKPKQLQGTSTDVEWPVIASLIITLDGN